MVASGVGVSGKPQPDWKVRASDYEPKGKRVPRMKIPRRARRQLRKDQLSFTAQWKDWGPFTIVTLFMGGKRYRRIGLRPLRHAKLSPPSLSADEGCPERGGQT